MQGSQRPGVARSSGWALLGWSALAAAGQVAGLQLMRAGPRIGYQRYAAPAELMDLAALPWLGVLALQAVLVGVAGRDVWADAWNWLRRNAPVWRIVAAVLLFGATAAVLERELAAYVVHLALGSVIQALAFATVLLAMRSFDAERVGARLERLLDGPRAGTRDRFGWWAAAFVVGVSTLLGWAAYQWHPHVPDELVYLLHARYFAAGMLTMPLPPVPAAFELDLMTSEATRWYSPVPPGWPAVLAVGARLGAPWLVNPLLAGGCVLLAYDLVRRLYDTRTARLTVLLLCASPWFLFMSMNLMTHTLTLLAALAGAAGVAWMLESRRLVWGLLSGACIGVLGLIRPLEGLIAAALFSAWTLLAARGAHRWLGVAVMGVAALAVGGLSLPYNAHLTGDPSLFPIMAYTDAQYGPGTNALGFGANRGLGWGGLDPFPGHGPIDVVVNTLLNLYQVNVELLGWATGSVLALLALPVLGGWRRADRMMACVILAVIVAHAFYWFSGGPDFGARYWYLMLVPALVLAARGVQLLADRLAASTRSGGRVLLGAVLLGGLALVVFVPWRAADKYFHYRNMRPDIRRLAETHDFGNSLVLIRGRRFPDYASAAAYNPVDLRAAVPVYAWDRSPEVRRAVLEAYRDRNVWIVAGPTVTGAGFVIERGPVSAGTLLDEFPR